MLHLKGRTAIWNPDGLTGAATFGALLAAAAGENCSERLNAMSRAVWNRLSRSFSRQCLTIRSRDGEMFRPDSENSGGSLIRIAAIVSAFVSRLNAFLPESSS